VCGIAGLVTAAPEGLDASCVKGITERLGHRGPDDWGYVDWDGRETSSPRAGSSPSTEPAAVRLAHRRLAILDLTAAAHQPMGSGDGRFHLVFNGEIYNYQELRTELEQLGCRFVSAGDTEVLLRAWETWGAAALPRLVGMFAFAMLDTVAGEVHLVRDPFGIKPLYYSAAAGRVWFASEPGALLEDRRIGRQVQADVVYEYLRNGMVDRTEATFFAAVRRIPPATHVTVRARDASVTSTATFWAPPSEPIDIGFDEAAANLRELFLDSVRLQLRSDVRIGAALSGGIDSSAIVGAMRAVAGSQLDLHVVSYMAADPSINEERWARLVAAGTNARMHEVHLGPADLVRDLDGLIRAQGEPFLSSSIAAQYAVFRRAAEEGITVMLDGQGADELFGGYRSAVGARCSSMLRHGDVAGAARLAVADARAQGSVREGAWTIGRAVAGLGSARTAGVARAFAGQRAAPRWMAAGWFADRGVRPGWPAVAGRRDVLRARLEAAVTTESLPALLRYEDRNSMAFSVESRVPFLDPRVASFALALPEHHLVGDDGTTKCVLRAAMRGLVPDEVLDRRDKIGFATPEQRWLGEIAPWVTNVIEDGGPHVAALHVDSVRREWDEVSAGRRRFDSRVWRWINLIRWSAMHEVDYG
jgi:asparagine synthase (glutamine-hydrolysing)